MVIRVPEELVLLAEIFKKNKFSLNDGKIHLSEIDELIKINNYYTKVEELKRRDKSK